MNFVVSQTIYTKCLGNPKKSNGARALATEQTLSHVNNSNIKYCVCTYLGQYQNSSLTNMQALSHT